MQEALQAAPAGIVSQFADEVAVIAPPRERQGPLCHLPIAGVRQIDASRRLRRIERLRESTQLNPLTIAAQSVEEAAQPAVFVAVLVHLRPDAELLAIVGENDDGVGMARGHITEIGQRLVGIAVGHEIAQRLGGREDAQQPAIVFAEVIAEQLVILNARLTKVQIVENGVFHAGIGDVRQQILLPDTLRHPHAAHARLEDLFQIAFVG